MLLYRGCRFQIQSGFIHVKFDQQ
uniref:Uncharacterized protein n=1 Tax=Anguilla anguilla TaxID=7936 RepID=A0A0E9XRE6_ANGAN